MANKDYDDSIDRRWSVSSDPDGCLQPRGADPRSQKGAPPSNTAPGNSQDGDFVKILRTGIDSLYLSYPGSTFTEAAIRLDALKKLAQSDDLERSALAQLDLADHLLQVHDRGNRHFQYILTDNCYRIEIAGLAAKSLPLAYARLSSELLTLSGARVAEKGLYSIISKLGQLEGSARVSRVDLCVDFITSYPLESVSECDWVTRAKVLDRFSVNRAFSGWAIGPGGVISARLYNKTLEIEKSGKTYLFPIWGKAGWRPEQTVWRLEFQLRRSVLKELGVSSFEDLLPRCGGLWRYATESWLRLSQSGDASKSRKDLPAHPLWKALAAAEWDDSASCERVPVEKGRLPSNARLFINGLSPITSFMAREGILTSDEGIRAYWRAAREFHDTRGEPYPDFEDYIYQKTLAKARLYNTVKIHEAMDLPEPGTEAVAKVYKQRSDG